MSAYESLAACYDELTYDIPYEKTLTFFERLCAREHVQPRSVLDLACGTGSLSMLLAGRGYRVIGADLSEDMLAEAERKARAQMAAQMGAQLPSTPEKRGMPSAELLKRALECCREERQG